MSERFSVSTLTDGNRLYYKVFDKKSGKFIRYPLHPYIDSCTEFIGYTNDKKQFIHGSLKQIYNRCRIDEIHAEELSRILSENKKNAQTYYVVTVEKLSGISSIPYDNLVPTNEKLNELIKQNGLNDVLFKTSPKVIDVWKGNIQSKVTVKVTQKVTVNAQKKILKWLKKKPHIIQSNQK